MGTESSRYAESSPESRGNLLEERFRALWRESQLPGREADLESIWGSLRAHYTEPHRHYHDELHLAHCLEQLDLARASVPHPDAVELALWFHDVINEPGARDNEQRSAALFQEVARSMLPDPTVRRVMALILATTHRGVPSDPDEQFIRDIDLSSFGCPWDCYLRDYRAVKAEFRGTEEEYYRGKKAFLEAMLVRPRIFFSDFYHARYEQQSRENIRHSLELIELRQD